MFGRMTAQVCKHVNIFIVVKKAVTAAAAAGGNDGSRKAATLLPPSFVAPHDIMRHVRAMIQKIMAVGDPGGPTVDMPLGMPMTHFAVHLDLGGMVDEGVGDPLHVSVQSRARPLDLKCATIEAAVPLVAVEATGTTIEETIVEVELARMATVMARDSQRLTKSATTRIRAAVTGRERGMITGKRVAGGGRGIAVLELSATDLGIVIDEIACNTVTGFDLRVCFIGVHTCRNG